MKKLKNLVLVGYGGMGSHNLEFIKEKNLFNISGIYDIDPKKIEKAKEKGLNTYESLDDVLNDKNVEVILIATPNEVHKEIAIKAMEAGKNVFCEKPVCMSSKELEEIIKVANKTGKIFTVHQNRRYDKDYLTAKKIINENLIGVPLQIESRIHGSRGIPGDWRAEKKHGGGMILDWGVHILDQGTLFFTGVKIKSVYCQLDNITCSEVDDGFIVILNYENGVRGIFEVGTTNYVAHPRFYLKGSHGTAEIGLWNEKGRIVRLDSTEKDVAPIKAGAGYTKTMAPRTSSSTEELPLPEINKKSVDIDAFDLWEAFINAIDGNGEIIVKHHELLRTMKLMEACFESNEKRQVIAFE